MKEGAPAGKRLGHSDAFLPQRKGGIEGIHGILGQSPALTHERTRLRRGLVLPKDSPSRPGRVMTIILKS